MPTREFKPCEAYPILKVLGEGTFGVVYLAARRTGEAEEGGEGKGTEDVSDLTRSLAQLKAVSRRRENDQDFEILSRGVL
jgi:serine/threonine protein kinase